MAAPPVILGPEMEFCVFGYHIGSPVKKEVVVAALDATPPRRGEERTEADAEGYSPISLAAFRSSLIYLGGESCSPVTMACAAAVAGDYTRRTPLDLTNIICLI